MPINTNSKCNRHLLHSSSHKLNLNSSQMSSWCNQMFSNRSQMSQLTSNNSNRCNKCSKYHSSSSNNTRYKANGCNKTLNYRIWPCPKLILQLSNNSSSNSNSNNSKTRPIKTPPKLNPRVNSSWCLQNSNSRCIRINSRTQKVKLHNNNNCLSMKTYRISRVNNQFWFLNNNCKRAIQPKPSPKDNQMTKRISRTRNKTFLSSLKLMLKSNKWGSFRSKLSWLMKAKTPT